MNTAFQHAAAFAAEDASGKGVSLLVLPAALLDAFFTAVLVQQLCGSVEVLLADQSLVMVFDVVLLPLPVIGVPVELTVCIGLLEDDIACVCYVGEDSDHCRSLPVLLPLCSDATLVQAPDDFTDSHAGEIASENFPDDFSLLRVDFQLPIDLDVAVGSASDFVGAVLELLLNRPLGVLRNGDGLALGNGTICGEKKLALHFGGIQIFLLEVDRNLQCLESTYQFQAVGGVPCESAQRLCEDHVYPMVFAVLHHPHKAGPDGCLGAGDTLIVVHIHQFPVHSGSNQAFVVAALDIQTLQLGITVGGDAAVCRHMEFLLCLRWRRDLFNFPDFFHLFIPLSSITY